MARAYLSLGSNLDPERHLAAALAALRGRYGDLVISPTYRTAWPSSPARWLTLGGVSPPWKARSKPPSTGRGR